MAGKSHRGNSLLTVELIFLFYLIPIALYFVRHYLVFKIIPLLLIVTLCCLVCLLRSRDFDRRRFWETGGLFFHLKRIVLTFIIPASFFCIGIYLFLNNRFLSFPKSHPFIWLILILLYPILAAYPQEIVFRGFFFHRYRQLITNPTAMILANSISFGLAHMVYANAVAPTLSAVGGLIFAYRYVKSDSLLIVGIEHALWGNFLFTIGIDRYFYSGSI